MKLSSSSLSPGSQIPVQFTGVDQDISPPLVWSEIPKGTISLAIICDDPDAPSRAQPRPEGPWVHWVLYNIPAELTQLQAAVPRQPEPSQLAGARQGVNDFADDNVGYRGPMPPIGSGPHRYFFKIYALDRLLDLPAADATKQSLQAAMEGHILGQAEMMAMFERK
jgi:Raf kinase inhibitor-like YbhB/YbcL family protein